MMSEEHQGTPHRCKGCGSHRVRPSRPHGSFEERLRSLTGTRYYQCLECNWRGRLPRGRSDPPRATPGPGFWLAVAALGAAVAYLIRRAG